MKKYIALIIIIPFLNGLYAGPAWSGLAQDQEKTLQTIIDRDDKVKAVYQGRCNKDNFKQDITKPYGTIGECIVGEVGAAKLEELAKKYIVNEKKKETKEDLNNLKTTSNPALIKLEKYLKKRLQETLYGKKIPGSKSKKKIVDQKVFFELYESQVGKNVISTLSSYCIETDKENDNYIIKKDKRAERRQANLNKLTELDISGNKNAAFAQWSGCIQSIQYVCTETAERDTKGKKTGNFDYTTGVDTYAKGRACNAIHYIRAMKQNLIAVKELNNAFEKRLERNHITIKESDASGATIERKVNLGSAKQTDQLTSITSNEFVNKSGYKKAHDDMEKDFTTKCSQNNDAEECTKYINNKDDQKKLIKLKDELDLKRSLLENRLRTMTAKEKEKFLKNQGYSDNEIVDILKNDLAKGVIVEKYKKEKEGIIESINQRISDHSTKGKNFDPENDQQTINQIKQELATKVNRYKDLIHFNNVISGYLQVGEGADATKNLATMHREVEDSAFDPKNSPNRKAASRGSNPTAADPNIDRFNKLQDQVKKQKKEKAKAGQGILTIKDINKHILKYSKETEK